MDRSIIYRSRPVDTGLGLYSVISYSCRMLKILQYLINFKVELWAGDEVVEPLRDDSILAICHEAVVQQVLNEAVPGTEH